MIQLGRLGRTTIEVDGSFVILIALFVGTSYDPAAGLRYALLWAPVLFLSVLLHELAHAGVISLFGHGPSRVVLGGMGGVTVSERRAPAWQETLISLAGPGASFLLAGAVLMTRKTSIWSDPLFAAFLPMMFYANLRWGMFNLVPVPPLDGGNVVFHFLRIVMRDRSAMLVSSWIAIIGGGICSVLFLYLRYYFAALLVGWFVYLAAQRLRTIPGNGDSAA